MDATNIASPLEYTTHSTYQICMNTYIIFLRFKSLTVREIIRTVLDEELTGKIYSASECEALTKRVVENVQNAIKQLQLKR